MARPLATQVDIGFTCPVSNGGASYFLVDIPRCLSLMNRKLFRAGYVYSLDSIQFSVHEDLFAAPNEIEVWKIPEIYNAHKAYTLAYNQWKKQRSEVAESGEVENTGRSIMGKWSDFKLWYNENHKAGDYVELLPAAIDAGVWSVISGGEWNRAEIVYYDASNTAREMQIGMLGDDNTPNYGGAIEAWGDVRAGILTPDPLIYDDYSVSWIGHLGPAAEDLEQPVEDLIQDENDLPPYLFEADPANDPKYVGASTVASDGVPHSLSLVNTINEDIHVSGGLFPLGMFVVKVPASTASSGEFNMMMSVTRGAYKGVAALKMGDFN